MKRFLAFLILVFSFLILILGNSIYPQNSLAANRGGVSSGGTCGVSCLTNCIVWQYNPITHITSCVRTATVCVGTPCPPPPPQRVCNPGQWGPCTGGCNQNQCNGSGTGWNSVPDPALCCP